MVRTAGPQDHILRLDMDMVLIICSLSLETSFIDFTNFFLTWWPYQTPEQISTLLHNLDWTNMHVHDRTWIQQANQKFIAFLGMCKDRRINHALCYDASKNLLLGNGPEEQLDVLQRIVDEHSASFVAFHVFSSIYKVGIVDMSATSLLRRLGDLHFIAELQGCVEMLRNHRLAQRVGWEERPRLTRPQLLLCSFGTTRLPLHFFVHG